MPTSFNSNSQQAANRQRWARQLHKWGLAGLASSLLASNRVVGTLLAQGLYIGQPLLSPWVKGEHIRDLADILEHPEPAADFARLLNEEGR